MIEAFFIGPSHRQVFATYHPPLGGGMGDLAVICPPVFSENMRTHHALRELAISLAERGQHVLRFDYRGTGDSACSLTDVALSDWVDDVLVAIDEGRAISGAENVRLLGIRTGALIASLCAATTPDIRKLVFWDPVADGPTYLETLREIQRGIIRRYPHLSDAERGDAMQDLAGYRLSPRMVEEFRVYDASVYRALERDDVCVVTTAPDTLPPGLSGARHEVVRFTCHWDTDSEDIMVPKPVLERLAACMTA